MPLKSPGLQNIIKKIKKKYHRENLKILHSSIVGLNFSGTNVAKNDQSGSNLNY